MVLRSRCCGSARLGWTRCKNKWCPTCARSIAAERSERLRQVVETFQWPLFATFTMRNTDDLGAEPVRALRRAWGRFRRMKCCSLVKGGVASIEVTNIGNGWHPHLHAVLDAVWLGPSRTKPAKWETALEKFEAAKLAKLALEAAWAKALRQETAVCHVKRCVASEVVKEVLKYAVKGQDLIDCEQPVGPMIDALTKCRLVTTFGSAHGFVYVKPPRLGVPCECGDCLETPSWVPQDVYKMNFGGEQWRIAEVGLHDLLKSDGGMKANAWISKEHVA